MQALITKTMAKVLCYYDGEKRFIVDVKDRSFYEPTNSDNFEFPVKGNDLFKTIEELVRETISNEIITKSEQSFLGGFNGQIIISQPENIHKFYLSLLKYQKQISAS